MTIEDRLAVLENEQQITQLLIHYCELVDSGRSDLIATEFYAEGIQADYHHNILNGRSEIHDFYVSGLASFAECAHSVSNIVIRSCDGDVAEASSMLIALHWHGEPRTSGQEAPEDFGLVVRSEDRLRRTPEGWRVTERRARALGPSFILKDAGVPIRRKD